MGGAMNNDSKKIGSLGAKILEKLSLGGPQDAYQLAETHQDPAEVYQSLNDLIEKELVQERTDCFRTDLNDPLTRIFGLPRNIQRN